MYTLYFVHINNTKYGIIKIDIKIGQKAIMYKDLYS